MNWLLLCPTKKFYLFCHTIFFNFKLFFFNIMVVSSYEYSVVNVIEGRFGYSRLFAYLFSLNSESRQVGEDSEAK